MSEFEQTELEASDVQPTKATSDMQDPSPPATFVWDTAREDQKPRRPLVEIGWVVVGQFDKIDETAIRGAREHVRTYLRATFQQFSWRVPLIFRTEPSNGSARVEPIALLDQAVLERQSKGWDFVVALTASDLHTLRKPYTLGTPSQGLDATTISTARLDPAAQRSVVNKAEREATLRHRIAALFYHLLGDLLGVPHSNNPEEAMHDPDLPEDLDRVQGYSQTEIKIIGELLTQVADLRVEETRGSPRNRFAFTGRVIARSGGEIWKAVMRNQPWTLVWHLSKFTGAAISSLLLLMLTAEVWDMGVRLPLPAVISSLIVVQIFTTYFVVTRQRLLTRRIRQKLTEQVVVTDLVILLTIWGAMVSMTIVLIALALGIIWIMPEELAARWTDIAILHWHDNLALAGAVATVGVLIGAFGASIEEQTTFRHVAFIDEET